MDNFPTRVRSNLNLNPYKKGIDLFRILLAAYMACVPRMYGRYTAGLSPRPVQSLRFRNPKKSSHGWCNLLDLGIPINTLVCFFLLTDRWCISCREPSCLSAANPLPWPTRRRSLRPPSPWIRRTPNQRPLSAWTRRTSRRPCCHAIGAMWCRGPWSTSHIGSRRWHRTSV